MKRRPRILVCSIASLAATFATGPVGHAQTNGTWTNVAGGSWGTGTNWSGGTIATGAGAVANFSTLNITANATVTLDGARTVGTLIFQDVTTASHDWILNTGTGGPLTLDVATGPAIIQVLNRTATIGAVVAGNDGINVNSGAGTGGTLVLGAANTFTGGLSLSSAVVQLNNANAAGGNLITLNSAASGVATRLVVNGGVTVSNEIVLGQAGTAVRGVAGRGLLERAGTGLGTFSGPITVNSNASAGGHFAGGGDAGSALVLNGVITSNGINLVQRAGFVRYGGGGTGYTFLGVTGTALVGANNGISSSAVVELGTLGGSGSGTLDLNGFNQTLAGVVIGNATAGSNLFGNINLGAGVLTLNGDITSISTATANLTHLITGSGAGGISVGAATRSIVVPDTLAADDVAMENVAITGTGTFAKTGAGTLTLNGVNVEGTLAVNAGAVQIGRSNLVGSLNANAIAFGPGATSVRMDIGAGGDVIAAGALTTAGTTSFAISQFGGALATGVYPLISYTGTSPGLGGFSIPTLPGRVQGGLVDTGSAIALQVTANDRIIWDGTTSTAWDTSTNNWKLESTNAATAFLNDDEVLFVDNPVSAVVDIPVAVSPSKVTFANSFTAYTVTGAAGINGTTSVEKAGDARVTLRTQNAYTGATTVSGGTLELDHDATGNVVLSGTSGVSIAAGATLQLTRDDGIFTFNRNLSGVGLVEINPHSVAGSATAHGVTLSGNNAGFTGTLRLLAPASGTYRLTSVTPAGLGSGTVEVQSGAQVYTVANATYNNPLTIAGTGFADANGNIGALRLESRSNWAGPITVDAGGARIGAHNLAGIDSPTVSGSISGGDLTVNATNYNNNYTIIFTGSNSYGATIIGGQNTQVGGVPTMRLNIGNGGTSGTLGAGPVTINGDGANGALGFDRADGYTLTPAQTITAAGSNLTRTFVDLDTLGAGFSNAGTSITLGSAAPASGGSIRIAQTRANAIANLSGSVTAERILVSGGVAGGVLNVDDGATINANYLSIGEATSATGGVVNQTGGTVNVVGQVRAGHFGTLTATYNLSGGALNLTGAAPSLSPSTAGAGGAGAAGDNNIEGAATAVIMGGGVYLGIDGTGVFNHTGGTLSTNWIVLDNRGNSGPAANTTGVDRYSISGASSVLALKSTWGLTQRNNSSLVLFGGGTVRVDNTGTGPNTGADLNIPLDAVIDTVAASVTNLDTNGAGNRFTLPRNVRGTGTLNLVGSGTIQFSTAGSQTIDAGLSGTANITKLGAGTTSLLGDASGYTGSIAVEAGRLDLPASLGATLVTVADGAAISGEPTVTNLALGTATGSTLYFDPTSIEAITATNLLLAGTTTIDFGVAPLGPGTETVLNYTNLTGTPTFVLANAAAYRSATVNTATPGTVTVDVTTKDLTWTGAGGAAFDVNTTTNWTDSALTPEKFFAGDTVTFGDGVAQTAVTVSPGVSPWKTTINSTSANYTLTSTGAGIAGPGGLEKLGASTLTLVGANTYRGLTNVAGGVLAISTPTSLGDGSVTNLLAINSGGRLSYTGNTASDFGANRSIYVFNGGGSISHNNGTGAAHTISGDLIGSTGDNLSFHSAAAGAGTFVLTGDNSAFTGNLSVDAQSTGLTVLRIATQSAVPGGGNITLNYPAAGANGNATTLDLPGVSLHSNITLNLTSFLNGGISLRTQVTSSGNVTIDSPIRLSGNSIVQFSPANGTLTINGDIGESSPGAFTNVLFLRSGGTSVVNGVINLPSATLAQTDSGTLVLNSTGNSFAAASALVGTFRIGANDAIPTTAILNLGQNSGDSPVFNLNGFNQTLGGLVYTAGSGGTKTITNLNNASLSTLTLNQATNVTMGGVLNGNLAFVKGGAGNLTLSNGGSTFSGNLTVLQGTVTASAASGGTNGPLGLVNRAGREIIVDGASTVLSFTSNNIFGNGVGNANLPTLSLNGSTLTSTRYNVLGTLNLDGATVTQAATDSGNFEGYQFKGGVNVTGSAPSLIATTNGKANHLDANTVFTVADVTGSASSDLVISAPLRNQSGDYASAAGGLTKVGTGTLEIASVSTYTGPTVIQEGTLLVSGNISGSATAVNDGGVLKGLGTVGSLALNPGGVLSPGASPGVLNAGTTSFAGGTFELEIFSATPGTGYDQLNVAGGVSITANTALSISLGVFDPVDDVDTFTVVLNDGVDAVSLGGGVFTYAGSPLAEGAAFLADGQFFQISYAGGDGNDVVLAAIPEPGTTSILLGALACLAARRRRRG